MSVLYDTAETVQSTLQGLTFTSQDAEVPTLAADAIVLRKVGRRERDFEQGHRLERLPGLLVVPRVAPSPPSAGVNSHDDVFYNIDVVMCARDYEREKGLETYTKWLQQIRQKLNDPTIAWPSDPAEGIVWQVNCVSADQVSDWPWVKIQEAVGGVQVQAISREPRG